MENRPHQAPKNAPVGVAFSWVVGALAWAVLVGSAMGWVPTVETETTTPPLWFALFFVFVLLARGLAIPLTRVSVASLDAGFYLAAAVCLGPLYAGLLVAFALTLDSIWRAVAPGPTHDPKRAKASYIFYFGGVSGALLMLLAGGFGLNEDLRLAGDFELVVRILGVGLLFLLVHYAIQGVRLALLGHSLKRYFRAALLPVLVAESSLMPLAVVVVFLYDPTRPLPFALLGLTYLVLNYGYNRISSVTLSLRARVSELEVLNTSSRHLAASLESQDLVSVFAGEIFRAARGATRVRLYRRTLEGQSWLVEEFDEDLNRVSSEQQEPPEEIARMIRDRKPLMGRKQQSTKDGRSQESWMAAPLEVHGELFGIVAAVAEGAGVFRNEQFNLLSSVAQQGAVALENNRLYELAMFDGLTGLYVRRYFDARLREEYQRSLRFGTEFSVVMIDVDDFKKLNDTLGHQAGDIVLRRAAEVVRKELRGVDAAARYGGEEFALILPRTPLVDAMNLAERIRQEIAKIVIEGEDGAIQVTASFGIAACVESAPGSEMELVEFADRALYRAKRTGKNRVELYWPTR